MKKLLLLGDSNRMLYQPHVATLLKDKITVVGNAGNHQYSSAIAAWVNYWPKDRGEYYRPNVVHFNAGIQDAGHYPDPNHYPNRSGALRVPINEYRENLENIVNSLLTIAPNLIWATTTPVYADKSYQNVNSRWWWISGDIKRYNHVALAVMKNKKIKVNDLYTLVESNVSEFLGDDQVHLTEAGAKACAVEVVKCVKEFL